MSNYRATIGLEVHAELKTTTKMFCRCKNDSDEERPNWNICPVCTAQPGTLPVINKKAVEHVLRVGRAVGGTLADFTEWDRKNYFYPDIPKGYQISQYKYPLVTGGTLSGVLLTRIHLEEDTGTSKHDRGDYSLIDFNRAGVPRMELVTEPVIHDAETAVRFAKELQLLLRYLDASDANMEKGEMRVEANISISHQSSVTSHQLGTKVEVKNLNSFKSVGDAIAFELQRQADVLGRGEKVVQETRGWDENGGKTFSQRKKESADDYRYFPEPDLPKMMLTELLGKDYEKLKALPELPWEKRKRLKKEFGFQDSVVELYVGDPLLGGFFEEFAKEYAQDKELIKTASKYISRDIASIVKEDGGVKFSNIIMSGFGNTMQLRVSNALSSTATSEVLRVQYETGKDISGEKLQKSDTGELKAIVKGVIAANEKVVADYKAGKEASLQFLIGQGMKVSKGSANPQILAEVFKKFLG